MTESQRRSLLCVACAASCAACGGSRQYPAHGTPLAPFARAEIEVEREGPVRDLDVEVHFLPPPPAVSPGVDRYVAWSVARDGSIRPLGALEYYWNFDYADLETHVGNDPFEVWVTAERGVPLWPSDRLIVRRSIPPSE